MPRRVLSVLLLAVAGGCDARLPMPPPGELAMRDPEVLAMIEAHDEAMAGGYSPAKLQALDATLARLESRYGRDSIEFTQALTEAGLLLIRQGDRYDLALPYFESALERTRAVFGTDHRETGFALHDLAVVRSEAEPGSFEDRVRPLMREAIAVRTRVLGPGHEETAGSERTLAKLLLEQWRAQPGADPQSPLLEEADALASRAHAPFERQLGTDQFEVRELRYLRVEIALGRHHCRRASWLAQDLITRYRQPCSGNDRTPDARELLAEALRGEGQDARASHVLAGGAPGECKLGPLEDLLRGIGVPDADSP